MIYSIVFYPQADVEFLESFNWYEKQSKGLGHHFFLSVEAIIKLIRLRPETLVILSGLLEKRP